MATYIYRGKKLREMLGKTKNQDAKSKIDIQNLIFKIILMGG
jgi:hypothetical protein